MMHRIGIYLKDERYLASLKDFLERKITGAEVVAIKSIKEFNEQADASLTVIIAETQLPEGIWLRLMPVLKRARHIILIAFPGGPEITDEIAKKYGAERLFRVPFPSNDLLAAIQEMIAKDAQEDAVQEASPETVTDMEELFKKLDDLDYYTLFDVSQNADAETIKKHYIAMARKYHPDKFRAALSEVRKMAYEITKRVNEAYSVLSHPNRRKMYDLMRRDNPDVKRFDFRLKMKYEENPHDTIHNKQARRFTILAQKAIEEGQLKQALTQLKMADAMEPGNNYILSLIEEVKTKIEQG